jgi:abhydrolase domain-containing protein 17
MIYFHGNAEDVGTTHYIMSCFRDILGVRVLAMEYRGYGLYGGASKSSNQVLEDALTVFDFATDILKVHPRDIFIYGRSIGCSMAAHVSRYRKPSFVILMSPFKTLQDAAAAVVGRLLSMLVANRFDNIECLRHVKCPVFIIHG